MQVLSWDNAPVSVQGEITALTNDIYTFTQTPDISFETMKQLGSNTSGVALRLMFTDAHMKARMKEELFGEMFTRRYNILKSAFCAVNGYNESEADAIRVTPIFTPFIPSNDAELVNMLTAASQGPIMSQRTAVERNPLVANPDDEIKTMEEQQEKQSQMNAFEPTI